MKMKAKRRGKHYITRFTTKMGMTSRPDVKSDAALSLKEVHAEVYPLVQRSDSYTFSIETPDEWVHHFASSGGHEVGRDKVKHR